MHISKKAILISVILLILIIGDKNVLFILNLFAMFYFMLQGKFIKNVGRLFTYLSIPIFLAGIFGLISFPFYDVFKDIYYLLNPILFIILGLLIAKEVDIRIFFRTIVVAGSIYSIIHITQVLFSFGISAFYDFRQVRIEEGGGHIISTISLVLCLTSLYLYKLKLFESSLFTKILIGVNGLSFLFSGSRTFWIIFILIFFILMYPLYRRRVWVLVRSLIILISLLALFLYNNSENKVAKSILNSSTELTIGDYSNLSDMNNKYRGWESYRAFATYYEGNPIQLIFGYGAGKMIDLNTYFFLAGEYRRYIPVLHNGYMYALVKSGIIGIFCYLLYFVYLFKFAVKKLELSDIKNNFEPLLAVGILISISISNIVVSGLYNPSLELLGVILGSLFYYLSNSNLDSNPNYIE